MGQGCADRAVSRWAFRACVRSAAPAGPAAPSGTPILHGAGRRSHDSIEQKPPHTVPSRSGWSNVCPKMSQFAQRGIYEFILVQVIQLSSEWCSVVLMLPMPPPGNITELGVPRKVYRKVSFSSLSSSLFKFFFSAIKNTLLQFSMSASWRSQQ